MQAIFRNPPRKDVTFELSDDPWDAMEQAIKTSRSHTDKTCFVVSDAAGRMLFDLAFAGEHQIVPTDDVVPQTSFMNIPIVVE